MFLLLRFEEGYRRRGESNFVLLLFIIVPSSVTPHFGGSYAKTFICLTVFHYL